MIQENNKKDISEKALQLYLKEIEQYSDLKLTPEEEKKLVRKIEKGDEKAKKKLARANLMLVVKIAKYYAPQSKELSILDLIQEGNLALYRATELYYLKGDYRFSTFATLVIGMAIRDTLMNRKETALRNLLRKAFRKAFEELAKKKRKKEFVKPKFHVLYYPLKKEEKEIKYSPEEKIAQILKIKNYIQKNISEAVKLLLATKLLSKTESRAEIKRILE